VGDALESMPVDAGVVGGGAFGAGAVVGVVVVGVVATGVLRVCRVCRDDGTASLREFAQPAASTDARLITARPGTIPHHVEPDLS
jgi:hypothetical protein